MLALGFVVLLVAETKGRTLEQIETDTPSSPPARIVAGGLLGGGMTLPVPPGERLDCKRRRLPGTEADHRAVLDEFHRGALECVPLGVVRGARRAHRGSLDAEAFDTVSQSPIMSCPAGE